ncbi:MAG TPA: hypothetical protein VFR68_02465 [Candidatus Dormibacteraeota bacterium]|nr:hypothetical protein [Candidatus Dormibacteraeota bacterium]
MIAITSKVKIAAGIAAGALTLGAAGAYAANANTPIPTYSLGASGSLSHNGQSLSLVSLKPGATLTLPSTFTNAGQCQSWFAQNRTLALAPTGSATTVKKNYHGKLLSGVQKFCATYATAKDAADTSTSNTEQPAGTDTETTDSTDSTDTQSGASHGHGHGHGHGHAE